MINIETGGRMQKVTDIDFLGFTLKRLKRSSYILTMIISAFGFIGIGLLVDSAFQTIFGITTANNEPTNLFLVFFIGWWIYAIDRSIRRLHDINLTAWLLLGIFVPFIGLLVVLILIFSKGTAEINKYGEYPSRLYIFGLGF